MTFRVRPLDFPELRQDPLSGKWAVIATDRASRPGSDLFRDSETPLNFCPFCEGCEHFTTPEILASRNPGTSADGPGWRVRLFGNLYAAVRPGTASPIGSAIAPGVLAAGAHDVIAECAHHEQSLARVSLDNFRDLIRIWRDRLRMHRESRRYPFALVFKNSGTGAGASVEHSHSQILAMPVIPTNILHELANSRLWYAQHGSCIGCDTLRNELAASTRIVAANERTVAHGVWASCWPFEMSLWPRNHQSHFEAIEETDIDSLAELLKDVLDRLDRKLNNPAYNLVLHTAPLDSPPMPSYHWHLKILPRVTQPAGFEWGTGCHINPVAPEQAAEYLREA